MADDQQPYEPNWKVDSALTAAEIFRTAGGHVLVWPFDISIGRLAVVEDRFGNRLVVLDSSKGTLVTDQHGSISGVAYQHPRHPG